jgi:hypothetical protein
MRLGFKPFDGRSWGSIEVIDEENGRAIGHIQTHPGQSIRISLFGGKYSAKRFLLRSVPWVRQGCRKCSTPHDIGGMIIIVSEAVRRPVELGLKAKRT